MSCVDRKSLIIKQLEFFKKVIALYVKHCLARYFNYGNSESLSFDRTPEYSSFYQKFKCTAMAASHKPTFVEQHYPC